MTAARIRSCASSPASVSSTRTARRSVSEGRRATSPFRSRLSRCRVNVGLSIPNARARSSCAVHSPWRNAFRISQDGADPPSAASVALNALPTTFAVIASLRPIGIPRAGIPRRVVPYLRAGARDELLRVELLRSVERLRRALRCLPPECPEHEPLASEPDEAQPAVRRVGDALRIEIQVDRDLLDESRVARSTRRLLEPVGTSDASIWISRTPIRTVRPIDTELEAIIAQGSRVKRAPRARAR